MNTKTFALLLASLASFSALAADLPSYDCVVRRYTAYAENAVATAPVTRITASSMTEGKPTSIQIPGIDETARIHYFAVEAGHVLGADGYEFCLYANKNVKPDERITNITATCVEFDSLPKSVSIADANITETRPGYTATCTQIPASTPAN